MRPPTRKLPRSASLWTVLSVPLPPKTRCCRNPSLLTSPFALKKKQQILESRAPWHPCQCEMGLSMGKWQVLVLAVWENLVLLKPFPLHITKDGLLLWTLAKSTCKTTALSGRCLPHSLSKCCTAQNWGPMLMAREKLSKANLME